MEDKTMKCIQSMILVLALSTAHAQILDKTAFADEVVAYSVGSNPPVSQSGNSIACIGQPDFNDIGTFVSLGCRGSITVKFVDNRLKDVDGDDLYVFEVGKYIEPTDVFISVDGLSWVAVGKIGGGTRGIDIAPYIKSGQVFQYVKLVDLGYSCDGHWAGADIDAIGAIGSVSMCKFN